MMVRVALDAMGGDRGPDELVSGAVQAVNEMDIEVILLGDEGLLWKALEKQTRATDRIEVVHAPEVITMDESPVEGVRRKKNSSIVQAFHLHKTGRVGAVVSAGNSGATMTAAIKFLGRLKNISRPGIASVFPTLKGPVVMMDVGANVDCRPQHLFQFGIMAAAFSQVLFGTEKPRIGLLSIGEEGGKGNVVVRKTHEYLQKSSLNFIGNVEGRDTFQGHVDVIVCDGFVGNVCLKLSEGLAEAVVAMLQEEIKKSVMAMTGYLLAKGAFDVLKKRIDYAESGGAPLLGLNGTAIVCHGMSNARAIKNAIRVAAELIKNDVNGHILALLRESNYFEVAGQQNNAVTAGSGS